jgi:hypothetical protein
MGERTCAFCGGNQHSLEHAFPRWVSDVVAGDGMFTNVRAFPHQSNWRSTIPMWYPPMATSSSARDPVMRFSALKT